MRNQKRKAQLRKIALDLWKQAIFKKWGDRCEVTGGPSGPPHHFFPKGQFGHLMLDVDNGIPISIGSHFAHHHKADPTVHVAIIKKRGQDWYENLKEKADNRVEWNRVWWFEEQIKKLEEFLNEETF